MDIDATYEDSEVDPSVRIHQRHHDLIHAAVNRQVSQGDLAFNLRDQPGVVGDGEADDTAALQAALDQSAAFGARAYANGTFAISGTLQITENADFQDAKFLYFGTGVALEVGIKGGHAMRKSVRLPHTYDLGTAAKRPRYVRAGTGVQTGAFATSARPSAREAGVGTCIFDTTLKRPIWSTGSIWVDANGRAV